MKDWQTVPKVLTSEMLRAMDANQDCDFSADVSLQKMWEAALRVAPTPASVEAARMLKNNEVNKESNGD